MAATGNMLVNDESCPDVIRRFFFSPRGVTVMIRIRCVKACVTYSTVPSVDSTPWFSAICLNCY